MTDGEEGNDLYATLEVNKAASVDEIRKNYQRLAKKVLNDKSRGRFIS